MPTTPYIYHRLDAMGSFYRRPFVRGCALPSAQSRVVNACPSGRALDACSECIAVGAFASQAGSAGGLLLHNPLIANSAPVTLPAAWHNRFLYVTASGQAGLGVGLAGAVHSGVSTVVPAPSTASLNSGNHAVAVATFPGCGGQVSSSEAFVNTRRAVISAGYGFGGVFGQPSPPSVIQCYASFLTGLNGQAGAAQSIQITACADALSAVPLESPGDIDGTNYTFATYPGSEYFVGRLVGRYGKRLTLVVRVESAKSSSGAGQFADVAFWDASILSLNARIPNVTYSQTMSCQTGTWNCTDPCTNEYRYEMYVPTDDLIIDIASAPVLCGPSCTKIATTARIIQATLA